MDGNIECPFHGWRFASDGRCTHAPFAVRHPKVSLGGFPVREHSGLIFVYVGSAAPNWEVPEIPEATSRKFAVPIDNAYRPRVHVQEIRENIMDESHFTVIHKQRTPPALKFVTNGPQAEARSRIQRRVIGRTIDNSFNVFMYGPGVMLVRAHGSLMSVTAVALTTPIDERTSEMRMLYYLRKPSRLSIMMPLLKLIFRWETSRELREEVRIWDHKIYRAQPILLPHEVGIKALRRWYAQFYH